MHTYMPMTVLIRILMGKNYEHIIIKVLFSKAEDFSTVKNILAPASNWQITNSCIRRVFKNPNFNLTPIIMPTSGLCVVLHVLQNEE